jgi:hypothetical protein
MLVVVLLFLLPRSFRLLLFALLRAHPGHGLRLPSLFALVLRLRLRLAPVGALVLLLLHSLLFLFHRFLYRQSRSSAAAKCG